MMGFQKDHRGWKFKTRFVTFHPVSYGTGTLARLAVHPNPDGRALMFHYFPPDPIVEQDSRIGRRLPSGPKLHDHPWSFWTLVLWGSYSDWSWTGVKPNADGIRGVLVEDRMSWGSLRHRAALHRHTTEVHRPTVTVVWRGCVERAWCEGDTSDWKCDGDATDFEEGVGMGDANDSEFEEN